MDNPILIAFISIGKSIRIQRFKQLPFLSYSWHHSFPVLSYNTGDLVEPAGVDWFFLAGSCSKCVTEEKTRKSCGLYYSFV